MPTRVITKELGVEQDLALGRGTISQTRGGVSLTLQQISVSKVITDVSILGNDTTATEYVDPNLHTIALVESYAVLGDEGGGTFYWDATINPAAADSGHIFASGIITGLGAWIRFEDDKHINVKHFGAIGDGVTDDTAALLLAVTALNTRLRGTLYFPEGVYVLNVTLNLAAADQVIVRGDGMQNTIIDHIGASGPLFEFDTGGELDEDAQFVLGMDFSIRTDQVDQTAIHITSTALVSDITRSAYFQRILFIGATAADGWKYCIHSEDVRGITVKDCYARHVNGSVDTIFWNIDNTIAFVGDDYTASNNETHFYENEFGALTPTGGGSSSGTIDGADIIDDTITIAKLADATAGDIIVWDAAGEAILLGIGAVGFVLTSNGVGQPPSWQAAGGGGGPVDSVFSRTGIVVAAASDYNASQIDNDSTVTGAFVDDALNQLDSDITAIGGTPFSDTADAVGSLAFAKRLPLASVNFGVSIAGSELTPTNADGTSAAASSLTGTWRCWGQAGSVTGEKSATLWVRIA